jgi:response regulator of citrate/malate metabolism
MVGLFPERREKAGGWPKVLTVIEVQILRNMALDKSLTVADTCKTLGISRRTFYRYLRACLVSDRVRPRGAKSASPTRFAGTLRVVF